MTMLFPLPPRVLVVVAPVVAAVNLSLAPTYCALFHPGRAPAACVGWLVAKVALQGVLLPLALITLLDLRARRVFLSTQAASAAGAVEGGPTTQGRQGPGGAAAGEASVGIPVPSRRTWPAYWHSQLWG